MDSLKKTLSERKKERADLQTLLDALYKEYGSAQFEYALHNTTPLASIAAQDFEAWKSLRTKRQDDADTILAIKTAQSRQNELKVFSGEVDKLLREQQQAYEKARNIFILEFFNTYRHDSLACITPILSAVEPLDTAIAQQEQEMRLLEQQKTEANFLKKITLSTQLITAKGKLSSLQKKRNAQVIASGDEVITDTVISEVRGDGFSGKLEEVYTDLAAIVNKQDEIAARKETLIAEQQKISETLTECGVDSTPQKRITVLTAAIKTSDEAIGMAEQQQGIVSADVFYTAEGAKIEAAPADIPESFKPYLDSIAEYRVKLHKNQLNITYIENEIAAAAESRKIEALQKAIIGYKDGIQQYEQLIAAAEQDIVQSEENKAALEQKNAELLPQFSGE